MGGVHPHHDVDRWWDEAAPIGPARAARRNRWVGPALLVAAFLVFKWTANPALATAVGCLKFGWDEFRISRYLKRRDPDRTRGRVVARFYLAAGFWRVSVVALSMPFVLLLIAMGVGQVGPIPPNVESSLMAAIVTALGGFVVSALIAGAATVDALVHDVPVWLGREARRAYLADLWPPTSSAQRSIRGNWASALILGALMSSAVFAILAVYLLFPFLPPLLFFLPFGIPVAMMAWIERGGRRIFAASPEACWGPVREVNHARA